MQNPALDVDDGKTLQWNMSSQIRQNQPTQSNDVSVPVSWNGMTDSKDKD